MNWEKNLKFISFIVKFISFYKFLVTVEGPMSRVCRLYIAERTADELESKSVRNGVVYRFKPRTPNSKWNSGICLVCGEAFNCISENHAQKCGFESANAMANSDKVRWF